MCPYVARTSWPGWLGRSPRGSANEPMLVSGLAARSGRRTAASDDERRPASRPLIANSPLPPHDGESIPTWRRCRFQLALRRARLTHMRTYVRLWSVCVLIPRFELLAAVGDRRELLREALALAPEPDRAQVVGEVSGAAQALGIHPGMRLGEALARCPGLRLIPPDPERAARAWEAVLAGAGGDRGRGRAGGAGRGVLRRRRPAPPVRRARGGRARPRAPGGAGPRPLGRGHEPLLRLRRRARARAPDAGRRSSRPAPSGHSSRRCPCRSSPRRSGPSCAPALERLGIRTLGELAALPSGALADRFGEQGLRARELAHGRDTAAAPASPRRAPRGGDRAAGGGLGAAAPARSGAADRSAARAPRRGATARCARCGSARASSSGAPGGARSRCARRACRANGCGWRWCRGSTSCPPRSSSSA